MWHFGRSETKKKLRKETKCFSRVKCKWMVPKDTETSRFHKLSRVYRQRPYVETWFHYMIRMTQHPKIVCHIYGATHKSHLKDIWWRKCLSFFTFFCLQSVYLSWDIFRLNCVGFFSNAIEWIHMFHVDYDQQKEKMAFFLVIRLVSNKPRHICMVVNLL